MIVDHGIKCINVPDHRGVVSSWYGVFENGNLINLVKDYKAAKMVVESRKSGWRTTTTE